ncbi:MAG TPA: PQQ-binding-like beta-propeller repeat protein [Planctomycetota bacterium]
MRTFAVLGILATLGASALLVKPSPGRNEPADSPPPAAQVSGEWFTYHGGYALDGVADQAPPDKPELLWRYKAGARVHSTPLVADGRVYTAHAKGGVAALGPDGQPVWTAQLGKEPFKAPMLYLAKTLVMGNEAGTLFALDADTGKEKWTYAVGDTIQGSANRVELPGGKAGVVVLSQSDGSLHCVDLETGKLQWKTPEFERCDGSPSSLAGRVVLGSCASALHVYDTAKPGKPADVDLGGDSQVAGGVALSGVQAFAGTRGGKLVAADVAAGKILWTLAESKKEAFATPAVGPNLVVFANDDGKVYGVDRSTGKALWSADTGGSPGSPVIAGNRVVVASSGTLLIFDLLKGDKIWSAEVSDDATPPAVAGGVIYVGADDGTVSAWGKK